MSDYLYLIVVVDRRSNLKRKRFYMRDFFIKFFVLTYTALALSCSSAYASTDIDNIRKILQFRLDKEKTTVGASIAIIDGDKTEFLNFGLSNKEKKQVMSSDILFEIGSISKTFTSIALASMVKEGKVKLTDPVQMYLPENVKMPLKVKVPLLNSKPITLISLANHSSGLPRLPTNMPYGDALDPYADYTVEMMYEFLNSYELTRKVGEKYEYSNLAVGLLGHVLGLIDNKPYQQVIADRVLKPLLMNSTYVDVPPSHLDNLSDGHNSLLDKTKHWQLPTLAGAGAIKSSAKDMALYLVANMDQKPLHDAITLSHEQSINFKSGGPKVGLAWLKAEHINGYYLWHNGGTGGFRAFIGFDQKNIKGIVILENSSNSLDDIGRAYLTGSLEKLKNDVLEVVLVDEAKLKRLNGQYKLAPDFILTVTNISQQLYVEATGQPKLPAFAKTDLNFVNRAVKASVIFELDENGQAVSLNLHQGGKIQKAVKLSETEIKNKAKTVTETTEDIILTKQQLDNLAGKFQLATNFIITTTNEKGQLQIQATGQPKIPFTTKSESEFFNKKVQAKIIFELDNEGKAISLTLFQAGQILKGVKK